MKRGLDVRIGINPISWSNDDLPSLGGETPLGPVYMGMGYSSSGVSNFFLSIGVK